MSVTTPGARHARLVMEYRRNRLERRYRRLLALYPKDHRTEHGDEMIDVLLAGALPAQRYGEYGARRIESWQHVADVADLMAGAARIRGRLLVAGLRRRRSLRAAVRDSRWSDALAVVSVVAPILLLVAALTQFNVPQAAAGLVLGNPFSPLSDGFYVPDWPLTIGAPLIALLGFCRMRRIAGLTALLTAVLQLVLLPTFGIASYLSPALAFSVLLAATAGISLLLSAGPARGFVLVRWWGAALIGVSALLLGGLSIGGYSLTAIYSGTMAILLPAEIAGLPGDIVIACVLGLAGVACLFGSVPRRVLALLAIPVIPYLIIWQDKLGADLIGQFNVAVPATFVTLYALPLAVACLIVAGTQVARRRSRTAGSVSGAASAASA